MSKEKQIEEKTCKKCLHYEMCLEKFRKAKADGFYEMTDEEEYFAHADERDFFITGYRKQSEGEWVTSDIPQEKYVCSVCGGACWYYDYQGDVAKSRYCPNCGAHMRKEDEGK